MRKGVANMRHHLTNKERFALETWKLFDKLIRSELPHIPEAWRYELSHNWDSEILKFLQKIDDLKNTKF